MCFFLFWIFSFLFWWISVVFLKRKSTVMQIFSTITFTFIDLNVISYCLGRIYLRIKDGKLYVFVRFFVVFVFVFLFWCCANAERILLVQFKYYVGELVNSGHTSAMLQLGRLAPYRPNGVLCKWGILGTLCCCCWMRWRVSSLVKCGPNNAVLGLMC